MLVADLERDLLRHLGQFLNSAESLLQERLNLFVWLFVCLHHSKLVACSIAVFQEKRAAQALDAPLGHDRNPVTQDVRLVHVVRCEHNYPVASVVFEHVPECSPRSQVHSSSRLVEHNELGGAA